MHATLTRVALVALATIGLVGTARAATPQEVLDDGTVDEWDGSEIDGWLAWSANSEARPKRYKAWVRAEGGSPVRVTIEGDAFVGDLIQTGAKAGQLVFLADDLGNGNIRFYDPLTDTLLPTPAGVNTKRREFSPRADGDYLTFVRIRRDGSWATILYRFSDGSSTVIEEGFQPTQVNGDFVVAHICGATTCNVWRYRISTNDWRKLPSAPTGRANYWPGVDANGIVSFVQGSHTKCGKSTKIIQWQPGTLTTLREFPDGIEAATLEARTVDGADQLLFTRIRCSLDGTISNTGIYELAI
jgi:hypothetical protein